MIRIAIICALLAGSVTAEGRNDPFYRCTFENGRAIILAEQGERYEWREDGAAAPALLDELFNLENHVAFDRLWAADRMVVRVGVSFKTNPAVEIGYATLTSQALNGDGVMKTDHQTGVCEDYFG